MADPFVAEIRMFPFKFAPKGWAWCDGQLLPLSQNTALFSLLGTTYGGNGRSTFALPNLQGKAPMQAGQGPGLSPYHLGQTGGRETVSLRESEMPSHGHALRAATQDNADVSNVSPSASFAASTEGTLYHDSADIQLSPQAATPTGGSAPHNNMQPYLTVAFCISLQGLYPSRQ